MSESDIPLYDPLTLHQQLLAEDKSRVNACNHTARHEWRWSPDMQARQALGWGNDGMSSWEQLQPITRCCCDAGCLAIADLPMPPHGSRQRITLGLSCSLLPADGAHECQPLAQERAVHRADARACGGGAAGRGGLPLVSVVTLIL